MPPTIGKLLPIGELDKDFLETFLMFLETGRVARLLWCKRRRCPGIGGHEEGMVMIMNHMPSTTGRRPG